MYVCIRREGYQVLCGKYYEQEKEGKGKSARLLEEKNERRGKEMGVL